MNLLNMLEEVFTPQSPPDPERFRLEFADERELVRNPRKRTLTLVHGEDRPLIKTTLRVKKREGENGGGGGKKEEVWISPDISPYDNEHPNVHISGPVEDGCRVIKEPLCPSCNSKMERAGSCSCGKETWICLSREYHPPSRRTCRIFYIDSTTRKVVGEAS
jgi:hypothetical protein